MTELVPWASSMALGFVAMRVWGVNQYLSAEDRVWTTALVLAAATACARYL